MDVLWISVREDRNDNTFCLLIRQLVALQKGLQRRDRLHIPHFVQDEG